MKFDSLLRQVGSLPWFDLAALVQLSGERRQSITNQMSRLAKAGRVHSLRRNMYALADPYRKVPVQPVALSPRLSDNTG